MQVNEWINAPCTKFPGMGRCLTPNCVSMLEQRIDEKTLNSVFRVSAKTTPFRAVLSVNLPFFYCLANFDYPQQ